MLLLDLRGVDMEYFEFDSSILPRVTLMYRDSSLHPHKNICRISDEYIFYLVTNGELHFCEDGVQHTLKAGETFLFEPGKLHFGTENSVYQLYYIHFRHPKVRKWEAGFDQWAAQAHSENKKWMTTMDYNTEVSDRIVIPKKMYFPDKAVMLRLCRLLEKAISQRQIRLENCNVLTACAVDEILIECYRQTVTQSLHHSNHPDTGLQCIRDVLTFLNTNYQRKITGNELEKHLSYNFDYLNQLFHKHLGITVFKMLEQIRMENAKELLISRDLNINYIATMVGFQNESYFSKAFKRYTGLSPSQYRAAHKPKSEQQ